DLPNPTRAEICYREILKRRPGDAPATVALVRVYVGLGDAVKALELQNGLVEGATAPEEKRDRTIALSLVYDEAGKDKKSAYAVDLKALRAAPFPPSAAELAQEMRVIAESVGVSALEFFVSPGLGPVFLPVSGSPAKLVMGQALLDTEDGPARYFALFRALK